MTTFDELFAEHNLTPNERKALVMHLATLRAQKTVEALQDCPIASAPSTPPPAVVEAVPLESWPIERAADMLTAYAELVKATGRYAEEHYIPEIENVAAELRGMLDQAQRDAYAEGRKDEREEMIALLKEEAASVRREGEGSKDGRYDFMAAGIEAAVDAFGGIDSATGMPATPELMEALTKPVAELFDHGIAPKAAQEKP